jgi:hypothetical protein
MFVKMEASALIQRARTGANVLLSGQETIAKWMSTNALTHPAYMDLRVRTTMDLMHVFVVLGGLELIVNRILMNAIHQINAKMEGNAQIVRDLLTVHALWAGREKHVNLTSMNVPLVHASMVESAGIFLDLINVNAKLDGLAQTVNRM